MISIIFNLIRSKIVAVLLGPAGTGLTGAFESAISVVQNFAGLGLSNSAVRDIATAQSEGNAINLSKTVISQRRAVLLTGLLGLGVTLALATPISSLTFDSPKFAWEIRLLAVAVFFNIIREGQAALLQGMRRIKHLAALSMLGAVMSSIIAVPLVYFLGLDGISVYIVMLAISQYIVSYYFAKKIKISRVSLSWKESFMRSKGMVQLGFAFMGGALATTAATYLIRVLVIRNVDLGGAGIYQAAMAISGLYINVVLQAMGKDFYPRLVAVANKPKEEISIINEQTEVGMILSAPGLLFTLALAPLAIRLLYTSEYAAAYPILQWMIVGVFLRTLSWPLGYLFIARAKTGYFFWIQIVSNSIHLLLVYFLIDHLGLVGTGVAFFGLYTLHVIYMYILARGQNGFSWDPGVQRTIIGLVVTFAFSFLILKYTSEVVGGTIVSLFGVGVSYFALRKIMDILSIKTFGELWESILKRIRRK